MCAQDAWPKGKGGCGVSLPRGRGHRVVQIQPVWSVCEDYPGGGPHGETRGVFLPYLVPTQVTVPESAALSELSVAVWCSIVSDSLKPHEL